MFLLEKTPVGLIIQPVIPARRHMQIAVYHIERSVMRRIDPGVFRSAIGFVVDLTVKRDP